MVNRTSGQPPPGKRERRPAATGPARLQGANDDDRLISITARQRQAQALVRCDGTTASICGMQSRLWRFVACGGDLASRQSSAVAAIRAAAMAMQSAQHEQCRRARATAATTRPKSPDTARDQLSCHSTGIELSEKYAAVAERRLRDSACLPVWSRTKRRSSCGAGEICGSILAISRPDRFLCGRRCALGRKPSAQ